MRFSRILTTAVASAAAVAGFAGSATAQTAVSGDIAAGTSATWCDDEAEMYLLEPIFVFGKLTIEPGCIVRGAPRTVPFDALDPTNGAPGVLIISQGGFLDAQGTQASPIIMTTGAIDADDDGNADRLVNGEAVAWDGVSAYPTTFLDDTPATNPLAPLAADGTQNASLWGGLVILGRAPTNLGEEPIVGLGYGTATVEGLAIPGFSVAGARYGGYQPHDTSGVIRYVSVRHAGDDISPANELNGITLGGVGDGTIMENIEVYANQDDGIEWFGGTVNVRNAVVVAVGDDSLDIDQGYTGVIQNALVLQTFFDQNNGAPFGADGGDAIGEWDGDDCGGLPIECNIELGQTSNSLAKNALAQSAQDSFPNNHPHIYNLTAIGSLDEDGDLPIAAGQTVSLTEDGLEMDAGFTGLIANTIVANNPVDACDVDGTAGTHEDDVIRVVASTFVDSGAPIDACPAGVIASGNAGAPAGAIGNGDAAVAGGSDYEGGSVNFPTASGEILVNDNYFFNPQGAAGGKLQGSKVGAAFDPRPAVATAPETSGGIVPRGNGLDASATYRGAFPAGQPLWTDGWTVISLGGITN